MGLMPYKNEVYLDWPDEHNVEARRAAPKDVESLLEPPGNVQGQAVRKMLQVIEVSPASAGNPLRGTLQGFIWGY